MLFRWPLKRVCSCESGSKECNASSAIMHSSLMKKQGANTGLQSRVSRNRQGQCYSLFDSRENVAAFQAAIGKGVFHEFAPPPGFGGRGIVACPDLWASALDAYLKRQGLVSGE